jgi:hypothetical protein
MCTGASPSANRRRLRLGVNLCEKIIGGNKSKCACMRVVCWAPRELSSDRERWRPCSSQREKSNCLPDLRFWTSMSMNHLSGNPTSMIGLCQEGKSSPDALRRSGAGFSSAGVCSPALLNTGSRRPQDYPSAWWPPSRAARESLC